MTKFILAAAFLGASSIVAASPASAFEVTIDEALCPIEAIGEAELASWSDTVAAAKGELSDKQTAKLGEVVATCAKDLSWSEKDTISAVEFNLSIISGTAIGDKLVAGGIDAVGYETVLENRSAEDLQQILTDPENSPALKDLSDKMIADLGDGLTDEITADLATYIAFMAQAQLSAMKMSGLAE
jgi:hypothetical protein